MEPIILYFDSPHRHRMRLVVITVFMVFVIIGLAWLTSIPAYTTPPTEPVPTPNREDCELIVGPLDMLNLSRPVLWCRQ